MQPREAGQGAGMRLNLTLLVVAMGVAVGHFAPATGVQLKLLSDGFIAVIKCFIGPIVFLTVTLGLAGMSSLRTAGRVGLKALIYFESMTTLALLLGLAVAWWLQPGVGLDPGQFAG